MKTMLLIPLIAYLMLVMTGNNPEHTTPSGKKADTGKVQTITVVTQGTASESTMNVNEGSIFLASNNREIRFMIPETNMDWTVLAPEVPIEATFEDAVPESVNKIQGLSPNVPAEATFEDSRDVVTYTRNAYYNLAPEVPVEATFEDVPQQNEDAGIDKELIHSLAPVVPMQANFSDTL